MTDAPTDVQQRPVDPEDALPRAKAPVGASGAVPVGQLAAVLLIGLGVLGIQETVHRVGLADPSWIGWLLRQATDRTATFATLVIAVLLVLAGLALLVVAFRPRPRRTLTLTAHTGVYLRTRDLARLASSRVDGAESITDVRATATRRVLTVEVTSVGAAADNGPVEAAVRRRVDPLLAALESAPRLTARVSNEDLT